MSKKNSYIMTFSRNVKNIKKSSKIGFLGGPKKGSKMAVFGPRYIRRNDPVLAGALSGIRPGKIAKKPVF